jgi:prophage antirepressor-like protein
MNNQLQVFSYEGNEVRTVQRDGETWWVLKDVCYILELSNSRMVSDRLDNDEKGVSIADTLGGKQELTVISESGLYNVIILSRKAEAKKFKRWVTHEVLPSIRKTGLYATAEAAEKLLNDPDFLIEALRELKAIRAKNATLSETVSIQNQQIAEMKPKAGYYDVILACKDAVAITTIAKDYGKSGQWLNDYLHTLSVQYKMGDIWLLYQKYAEYGYTCTKTHNYLGTDGTQHSKVHTYWTQKGRLFIYGLLKSHGWLPLIEQDDFKEDGDGQT